MLRHLFLRGALAIVAAALLAAPGIISPHRATWADVGELPDPGGLVTPGDKTDEIRMKSESVVFSIRPNDGTFPQEEAQYFAHVTADFSMENLTPKAVSEDLFFPFHSWFSLEMYQDPMNAVMRQAANARVSVRGREVQTRYAELAVSAQESLIAVVFPVTFPAGSETAIRVEYDVRAVHEPKSPSLSFEYLMQTGSHWAGTIGSGKVVFEFWVPVDSENAIGSANDFFQYREGRLEWEFADLEPTPDHDIAVTFEPTALEAWAARPFPIEDIRASAPPAKGIPDTDCLRAECDLPGGSWHPSPAYLLDTQDTGRGWVVEQAKGSGDAWLQVDLDGEHIVAGLLIRSGVLERLWRRDAEPEVVYDTYRRPRTVVAALADGTTRTATLEDTPAEWQMIPLPNIATSSIRLSFPDGYPGTYKGDGYLGIGRIRLVGVDAGRALPVGACTGPNLLRNGDLEEGFGSQGTGLGWSPFSSGEGASYAFSGDRWPRVAYQGAFSQLIMIASYAGPVAADRSAGISQALTGLDMGAEYELSLAGLIREEAAHSGEDPYRYRVQWALAKGGTDWTQVTDWQDVPWDTLYLRTEPGEFPTYTTRLFAPSDSATLFIRAWKKWATAGRELDVNLDAIALRRCGPQVTVEPQAAAWQKQSPAAFPSRRMEMGFVYDLTRHVVVAVGGTDWKVAFGETWEYDGTAWTLRKDVAKSPARIRPAMDYDRARQVVVLFGGSNLGDTEFYNDTWEYDGNQWLERTVGKAPAARNGAAVAYDPVRRRLVLFGGYYRWGSTRFFDDTWEFDGEQWVQRTPAHHPEARETAHMVYDPARGKMVLFGGGRDAGGAIYNDTWEWDGNDWTQRLDLRTSPPARWAHGMAYDEGRERVILFGGLTGTTAAFDDTWEFDGQTWVQVTASPSPSARWDPGLAYDSLNERTVLFGGMEWDGEFGWLDDTWHYAAP